MASSNLNAARAKLQMHLKKLQESSNRLKQLRQKKLQNDLETLNGLSNNLDELYKKYLDIKKRAEDLFTFQWPTESRRITSNFGESHTTGIDIGAKTAGVKGDTINAINSGTVATSGVPSWSGSQATYVIINGDDGYEYRYVHLDIDSSIKVGTKITRGQKLGTMGDNGSPGQVHLHLEVIIDGKKTDPLLILPK